MILALTNAADEHFFEPVDFKLRVVCLLFSLVATLKQITTSYPLGWPLYLTHNTVTLLTDSSSGKCCSSSSAVAP